MSFADPIRRNPRIPLDPRFPAVPTDLDPQDPGKGRRRNRCGTMEEHRQLVRLDPEYRWRREQIEKDVQQWIAAFGEEGSRTGIIRIPVVVHVIWHTAAENISDAQIHSQIDVLNADFRRLNADAGSVPSAFAGVAADARVEFALAVRGPGCAVTTGITRTETSVTGWTRNQTGMLSAAGGGHDPWDVTRYLNVWVCNYTDGLLGKGSFPGMPNQGVRCHYRAFGSTGTLGAPYDLGRTMVHEVGHYLNLNHIWGDDGSLCTGTDNVADTPNQADEHYGTPTFPQVSCSNGPDGDMFMNYMDYTDDAGMFMFTAGQSERMDATLHTARTGLLASDGLVPSSGAVNDLWAKDTSDDDGAEPNPSGQPMWVSDDIWVRNDNNGIANQDHQNPEHGSGTTSVYVRVRNRGCSGTSSGTVRLYWAKASTGLAWPAPWDGSVTSPALMGGEIGSAAVSVSAGDDEILAFPWSPPDPADYASFGADRGHFCLLARIETGPAPDFGMTSPETGNLYANVQQNNNIVWKNITVVDEDTDGRVSAAIVANYGREATKVHVVFRAPRRERSMLDWGEVWLEPTNELRELWKASGGESQGLEEIGDGRFRIAGRKASLGPIALEPGQLGALGLRFVPTHRERLGAGIVALDVWQLQADRGEPVGGQRFVVKLRADRRGLVLDQPKVRHDGIGWIRPRSANRLGSLMGRVLGGGGRIRGTTRT